MKSHLPLTAILGGLLLAPVAWSRSASFASRTASARLEPERGVGTSEARTVGSKPAVPSSAPVESESANPIVVGNVALTTLVWEGSRAKAQDSKGRWLPLTLDRALQNAASQLLRSARPSRGAVVVISAADGQLLALAEYPPAPTHVDSLLWSANTPSASLFKLVTTAALIERAGLKPEHRVCSEGGMHRLEAKHLEAPTDGHVVCTTFSEILAVSRNAAYARLVHRHLAPEELANFADRFGFNAPLPADVPAELGRFQSATEPLKFARTATGFVGSSLSALGAAYLGLVVARGGIAPSLRLLDIDDALGGLGGAGTEESREPISGPANASVEPRRVLLPSAPNAGLQPQRVLLPSTASRLRDMMERVVAHGTAADAFRDETGRLLLPNLRVAGKTGTLGRDEHTASWFVGFAPSRAPKLVVAVLLDNGPVWQTTAKRVASSLMREYFDRGSEASLARK